MSGWEVRFSNSRQLPYFYNAQTSQSVWEVPADVPAEQVMSLPGAAKYLNQGGGATGAGAGAGAGGGGRPGQVRASHILCKHAGSRRPSSWREQNITRSLGQAREIINKHIQEIQSAPAGDMPRVFAQIASTESDCSSAKKGGDLGWFGQGMMQKSFEDAAMALQPGQLSDIVESDSGVHVILRTG